MKHSLIKLDSDPSQFILRQIKLTLRPGISALIGLLGFIFPRRLRHSRIRQTIQPELQHLSRRLPEAEQFRPQLRRK
jgi:hypothetical protein